MATVTIAAVGRANKTMDGVPDWDLPEAKAELTITYADAMDDTAAAAVIGCLMDAGRSLGLTRKAWLRLLSEVSE
jgi:hypothetical protein